MISKTAHRGLVLLLLMFLPLFGRVVKQQNTYQEAIAFERTGQYAKAESLFVDLYNSDRNNYNYYNRYRQILVLQRKFTVLQPVMEERIKEHSHDAYLKLELGMLYFAMEQKNKAKKLWSEVFKGKKANIRNSYAVAVYQDALEYRTGNEFHLITDMLRSVTNDPQLLINYNFSLALRYRNWDQAVDEIMHILKTDAKGLRYVRQSIFRYDPLSALYPRAIHALKSTDSPQGVNLLSEIYIHLKEYEKAFECLKANIDKNENLKATVDFANRMFKQSQFELAVRSADLAQLYLAREDAARESMALLSAQAEEQMFYNKSKHHDIISYPYDSDFLSIDFLPFDAELSKIIESAYAKYDSLRHVSGRTGEIAAMKHAQIAYRVYQDFDGALQEYSKLASAKIIYDKSGLISQLSQVMLAKGEYERALEFIQTAGTDYELMVHEEDHLLPYELYVSVISGQKDSIIERTENVLAMLPLDDPVYNDMLAFSAVVNKVMRDSLNYPAWLDAERYILMNNTASAIDIYKKLLDTDSEAKEIYGLRYLDCLKVRRDTEAEMVFWSKYYDSLIQGDMSDYFMLRYARFMEKMQKFDIAYEIFEKYLLSYQESMYYENIREYVREHYSLGAP